MNLTLLTIFFLTFPFILIYLLGSKKNYKRIFTLLICLVLCALPMIYGLIDNHINDYEDANIGLGLLFFITWGLTAIPYFVLIGLLISKFQKKK